MDIKMRQMLISLSNLIRPDDLKAMKFFCKDIIPTKARDGIQTSVDLFEKLEERGKLGFDDLSFLELLLGSTCAGRTDMQEILHNFKENIRTKKDTSIDNDTKDLGLTFDFLVKNLGREYLMVLRRLGVKDSVLDQLQEENPRNVQEVIHKALEHWNKSNADSSCQERIIHALQAERRNDLAQRLIKGDLS